ncbi:MAG TPA: thiamine diphosphokinase [Erysipelothrix sp.]|jgi:thiamine pyrophosphokinase|nr:thiamine diphosphokinase [Erysipelothrix sp.]
MESVVIVLGHGEINLNLIPEDADIIGVDGGASLCAKNDLMMDLAIGDFDSVTAVEFEHIQMRSRKIVQLDSDKDDSDFEAALTYTHKYDELIVFGHWGKRFDHTYVNLQLLKNDLRMTFIDNHNKVFTLSEGFFEISRDGFEYISVFALSESEITLSGTQYELEHRVLDVDDVYTLSNKILNEHATLKIHSGKLLIIQSKD